MAIMDPSKTLASGVQDRPIITRSRNLRSRELAKLRRPKCGTAKQVLSFKGVVSFFITQTAALVALQKASNQLKPQVLKASNGFKLKGLSLVGSPKPGIPTE